MRNTTVDEATLRRLAVAADADPRTVKKRLAGKPVRGMVARRIDAVLARENLLPPFEASEQGAEGQS